MPAKSNSQRKFMCAVASGRASAPGLGKGDAEEFCHTKGDLPDKTKGGKAEESAESKPKSKKKRPSGWRNADGSDAEYK